MAIISILGLLYLQCFHDYNLVVVSSSSKSSSFSSSLSSLENTSESLSFKHDNNIPNNVSILQLTPLTRPIDYEQYTIRINTWRRNPQLLLSVEHHSKCQGVAQIQVIWCDSEKDPPPELFDYSKVVVEKHAHNSLNERFHILSETPTFGILSLDDDVIRPCIALDAAFFIWTQHFDRMVTFYPRLHHQEKKKNKKWKYSYQLAEQVNRYSMGLTKSCFLHRDYMDWYMTTTATALPRPIFQMVETTMNCEDLAMSLFVSSLTQGRPPLLAPIWALQTGFQLQVSNAISQNVGKHMDLRSDCLDFFAQVLGLKDTLQTATIVGKEGGYFEAAGGDDDDPNRNNHNDNTTMIHHQNQSSTVLFPKSPRQVAHEAMVARWKALPRKQFQTELSRLVQESSKINNKDNKGVKIIPFNTKRLKRHLNH